MTRPAAAWSDVSDGIEFEPDGHGASGVVHRRAFRALIGRQATGAEPLPADCVAYFDRNHAAFEAAAAAKIRRKALAPSARFHLTSRDIRRALSGGSGLQVAAGETLQEIAGEHAQQRP